MVQSINKEIMERFIYHTSWIFFLLTMGLLLIGIPFGAFYDLILFIATITFIGCSIISITLNGFYFVTKKKPARLLHMIVPALLLACSVLYVLYAIGEDYHN